MIYNVEGYLPKAIKAARKAAQEGRVVRKEMTPEERKANLERYAYPAGKGWTSKRRKKAAA